MFGGLIHTHAAKSASGVKSKSMMDVESFIRSSSAGESDMVPDRDAPVNIGVIINRKKENYTNFYLC
jgi:hypothetical protein